MTNSPRPESSADQEEAPFEQSSSKGFLKKRSYLLVGSITLVGFVLIAASITIVSMQGANYQTAERARLTVQEATIVGPLVPVS